SIHGGIFYALIMYYNQFLIFLYSAKRNSTFAWLIAIVIVGTCLIPDMFATRFLTIIVMVALMETSSYEVSFFAKKPPTPKSKGYLFILLLSIYGFQKHQSNSTIHIHRLLL
ncbi:hypothetical protein A5885_000918, partial [Enterococcus sp. 8E11_MSG4843]